LLKSVEILISEIVMLNYLRIVSVQTEKLDYEFRCVKKPFIFYRFRIMMGKNFCNKELDSWSKVVRWTGFGQKTEDQIVTKSGNSRNRTEIFDWPEICFQILFHSVFWSFLLWLKISQFLQLSFIYFFQAQKSRLRTVYMFNLKNALSHLIFSESPKTMVTKALMYSLSRIF